jgi:hypothetical protein
VIGSVELARLTVDYRSGACLLLAEIETRAAVYGVPFFTHLQMHAGDDAALDASMAVRSEQEASAVLVPTSDPLRIRHAVARWLPDQEVRYVLGG